MDSDDVLWKEYNDRARDEDARLIDGWTKITDVTLIYVALLSGALTAFIIQTANHFRPDPQEVTNQLLLAIYHHNLNPSTAPVSVEKLFKLDDHKFNQVVFQNSMLYTSLAISVAVAAVAMAAKLWIARYKHEVSLSGPPRLCAIKRQEVYDGATDWKMGNCIEALPVMALIAVIFFWIFIYSSISEGQKKFGIAAGLIVNVGLTFVLYTSFTAAFISTSPFRSPFSDFVNFVFRIFRDFKAELRKKIGIRPRTIVIILATVAALIAIGFLIFKYGVGAPLIHLPVAAVFALAREETEEDVDDIQPRLYNLPAWLTVTSCGIFINTFLAFYLSKYIFLITAVLLAIQGFGIIKLSRINPRTAEANAIVGLLSTRSSRSKSPELIEKVVQIARKSRNLRARLLKPLLPFLAPLITDERGDEQQRQKYLGWLSVLMDYEPCKASIWLNRASTEHPNLPTELKNTLKAYQQKCTCEHNLMPNQNAEKKRTISMDGTTERCPEECPGKAAGHILQMLRKDEEPKIEDA